jgi:Secretion system C-terminal sorting domain
LVHHLPVGENKKQQCVLFCWIHREYSSSPYPMIMRKLISISLLGVCALGNQFGFCQCSTSGPAAGTSFTSYDTLGLISWNSPGNSASSNNQFATAGIFLSALSSINTYYLTAENFGFSIPLSATICGIQVSIEREASGILGGLGVTLGAVADNSVKIIRGGVVSGTEHKSATAWTESDTYASYGSNSDDWGLSSWVPADINSSNFGVAISANLSALVGVTLGANVDVITLTVSYITIPLAVSLSDFGVSQVANASLISWRVAPDNGISKFIVQRSSGDNNWENIDQVTNEELNYSYLDNYPFHGLNQYRLQVIKEDGTMTYSAIASLWQKGNPALVVYPNPAQSYVTLQGADSAGIAVIKDLQGRIVKSFRLEGLSPNKQFSVGELPAGLYFLQVAGKVYKFVKQDK